MTKDTPTKIEKWDEFPEALSDMHFYYPFDAGFEFRGTLLKNPHVGVYFAPKEDVEEDRLYVPVRGMEILTQLNRCEEDKVRYAVTVDINTENAQGHYKYKVEEITPITKGASITSAMTRNTNGINSLWHILGYPPIIERRGQVHHSIDDVVIDKKERHFSIFHVFSPFNFVCEDVQYLN